MIRYIYSLGFLALLLAPSVVFGQGFLSDNRTTIELSNQYPEPNETIEATVLNQNSSNLPGDIVWRINGVTNTAFTNARSIEVTASDLGTPTVIQVTKSGTTLAQTVVNPVYIDINADPLTYIPETYQGRAEVTPGSTVLLTAIVEEAAKRDPSVYTYTWEVNGEVVDGGAWNGRYRIQAPVPIGSNTMEVTVSVSRAGIGKVGEQTTTIPVRSTETSFYRVSSLYGMSPIAMNDTHDLLENTVTLRAVPYFMANEAAERTGATEWTLDNRSVQPDSPFTITLQPNRSNGQSTLLFRHFNPEDFSQQAQRSMQLTY